MSDASQQTIDQRELVAAIPRELYYAGGWHAAAEGARTDVWSPSTGQSLGKVAWAGAEDVDLAVRAAHTAFFQWRDVKPLERAKDSARGRGTAPPARTRTGADRRRRLRQSDRRDDQ